MKNQKTISSFTTLLKTIKDSGLSLDEYCKQNDLNKASIQARMSDFRKSVDSIDANLYQEGLDLYKSICPKTHYQEPVDTGNYTEITYDRDEDNHIIYYNYKIYRKNKNPLVGKFSRDEMNTIYRLYSYYGSSLTQREVSRYFPELSLVDFKRILSAFNIYKASAPFAPHIIEEKSMDELREMQIREKENDFLCKWEEDRIKSNERLLKKCVIENDELKKQIDNVKNLQFEIKDFPTIKVKTTGIANNDFINIYVADMHLGAAMGSGSIYDENIDYGEEEALRRLNKILDQLSEFGTFQTINICLMGDMIDCCGPINKTARLDHSLPENMDGFEQANGYISVITTFVKSLAESGICNEIKLYSVRCGNHTGVIEYVATRALFAELKLQGFNCTLFNSFLGSFSQDDHQFVLTHGKDEKFMKRGLPLVLDDKNKVLIYEWLEASGIYGENIHIIKGDLHSSNYSSCRKFDYRNVLSLFGASDYSAFNFSRNFMGCSYDLCIGGNLVRGEFLI